jgi:hypothetical protein
MLFAGRSQDMCFLGPEALLAIDQAKDVGLLAVFDLRPSQRPAEVAKRVLARIHDKGGCCELA